MGDLGRWRAIGSAQVFCIKIEMVMVAKDEKIMLYAVSTCSHCKALMSFLKENHVDFDFINVDELQKPDKKKIIEEVKRFNKRCSFPTTVIGVGDKVVVGFREDELREALEI